MVSQEEKREKIERVLGGLLFVTGPSWEPEIDFGRLAEQVIVIECEVEHKDYGLAGGWTSLKMPLAFYSQVGGIEGHHGTPGKALAIIVPLTPWG